MGTHVHTLCTSVFFFFCFIAFLPSCLPFFQIIILATVKDNNDSAIASLKENNLLRVYLFASSHELTQSAARRFDPWLLLRCWRRASLVFYLAIAPQYLYKRIDWTSRRPLNCCLIEGLRSKFQDPIIASSSNRSKSDWTVEVTARKSGTILFSENFALHCSSAWWCSRWCLLPPCRDLASSSPYIAKNNVSNASWWCCCLLPSVWTQVAKF